MKPRQIKGKAVVITGAASGIGEALSLQLARQGARLLIADIDTNGLIRVAKAVQALRAECHMLVVDTGSEAAVAGLASEALTRLGGADIVINNAGVALMAPINKLSSDDAHWLMNINFWGVVHGCRYFLGQMKGRPDTVLVNISSIFAMVSIPTQSIYNASKAAVRGFSDALREELRGEGIDVLCVHPGGIRTNIANSARITDVSMVADSDQQMREAFTRMARTTPEQAALVILGAITARKSRVLIGGDAKLMDLTFRLFPGKASQWFTRLGHSLRLRVRAQESAQAANRTTP